MSTNYPSSLDSLANPLDNTLTSGGGNAALGHAKQHADANDAIEAIETTIGITNSTDVNSIQYKLTQKADANHQHTLAHIAAAGTPSATTYLRGDGTWSTPSGGGGGAGVISIITSSGTWTKPVGCTSIMVEVIGGGGGGGLCIDQLVPEGGGFPTSGQAGQYAKSTINVSSISSGTVVIGAGGLGGSAQGGWYGYAAAGGGGESSFIAGATTVSARGGNGGDGGTGLGAPNYGAAGAGTTQGTITLSASPLPPHGDGGGGSVQSYGNYVWRQAASGHIGAVIITEYY